MMDIMLTSLLPPIGILDGMVCRVLQIQTHNPDLIDSQSQKSNGYAQILNRRGLSFCMLAIQGLITANELKQAKAVLDSLQKSCNESWWKVFDDKSTGPSENGNCQPSILLPLSATLGGCGSIIRRAISAFSKGLQLRL